MMGVLGLEGARRGKAKRTTIADPQGRRADDLVQRKFNPVAPNVLWVADFTYVSTWSGWVYVAFVIVAHAVVFLAAVLLLAVQDRRIPALGALAGILVLSGSAARAEITRLRRPGVVSSG